MKFLWTKNNKPGSKLIQWGLGEDCSHFAIEYDGLVYESRLETGFSDSPLKDFLRRNTVVHTLAHNASGTAALAVTLIKHVKDQCTGRDYDTNGIAWWTVWALKTKLFGGEPMTHNQWQNKHKFYCVEILKGSEQLIFDSLKVRINPSVQTPYGLFVAMSASPRLKVL